MSFKMFSTAQDKPVKKKTDAKPKVDPTAENVDTGPDTASIKVDSPAPEE